MTVASEGANEIGLGGHFADRRSNTPLAEGFRDTRRKEQKGEDDEISERDHRKPRGDPCATGDDTTHLFFDTIRASTKPLLSATQGVVETPPLIRTLWTKPGRSMGLPSSSIETNVRYALLACCTFPVSRFSESTLTPTSIDVRKDSVHRSTKDHHISSFDGMDEIQVIHRSCDTNPLGVAGCRNGSGKVNPVHQLSPSRLPSLFASFGRTKLRHLDLRV